MNDIAMNILTFIAALCGVSVVSIVWFGLDQDKE